MYLTHQAYMGFIAGRYANRIAKVKFQLNNTQYQSACNNGPNHLHGGNKGFDKVIWDAVFTDAKDSKLSLSFVSKDGEEGFFSFIDIHHFSIPSQKKPNHEFA